MNTKPLTPLQEFMAERTRDITDGGKLDGPQGAMCRLMQRLDTAQVTEWIDAELKRGTTLEEIADGLGNYVANLIAPLCVPMGNGCHGLALFIVTTAMESFHSMTQGEGNAEAIIVHRHTGAEHVGTVAGFAQNGMPKP